MLSPAAADMDPQLAPERRQAALQRTDHAGGDSRGVPVHSHYGAKRLEPVGVGKTPQQLVAPIVMYDSFADHHAQAGHPIGEPLWNMPAVQRKIGSPSPSSHQPPRPVDLRLVTLSITEHHSARAPSHALQIAQGRAASLDDLHRTRAVVLPFSYRVSPRIPDALPPALR